MDHPSGMIARQARWNATCLANHLRTETAQMADINVLPMPRVRKARKVSTSPRPSRQTFGLQRWVASASLVVTSVLLGLSLVHLSTGIQVVTRCHFWEAACLALAVDAAMVCCEAAILVSGPKALCAIKRWASGTILCTVLASAGLNSLAFAQGAEGAWLFAAIAAGCAVPGLVYALTRVSAGLMAHR
jgi:hypothetical protein